MKTRDELLSSVNSLSEDELKRMAFTYLQILDHIDYHLNSGKEERTREKMRLLIAQKNIQRFYNNY
jgi:hypothetical protein